MSAIDNIKTMIGITADEPVTTIVSLTEARLRNLLGGAETLPNSLEYIVTEVSIARYNRIGSEGLSGHSVEGESLSWSDDDFAPYSGDIAAYQAAQDEPVKGRVRFL